MLQRFNSDMGMFLFIFERQKWIVNICPKGRWSILFLLIATHLGTQFLLSVDLLLCFIGNQTYDFEFFCDWSDLSLFCKLFCLSESND